MIGILSVGGHVPRYRLSGKALGAVWGGGGGEVGGERAVANYDEDSLTMSCEAALNALHGRDLRSIGACFLASTSAPYAEKSSAAILATVADLSPAVLTADLGGSLRCGTTALRLALDTVKAGSAAQALVAAGDVRPVAPGTAEEAQLGDGAGPALVGGGDVIASFEGAYTASHDFTDVWRLQGDRYLTVLPDATFVKAYGLDKHIAGSGGGRAEGDRTQTRGHRQGRPVRSRRAHPRGRPQAAQAAGVRHSEGGQLADCDPATVGFEMPVELCFRRIHEGEGFISYFWKFRPA